MVKEEPSSGKAAMFVPFIDEIGAFDLREFAMDLVKADFVCSFNDALVTEAEKAVPALVRLGSISETSKPYDAAEADAANPWVSAALKSICSLILKLSVCFSPVEVIVWFINPSLRGFAVAVLVAPPVITEVKEAEASRSSDPPNRPASINFI